MQNSSVLPPVQVGLRSGSSWRRCWCSPLAFLHQQPPLGKAFDSIAAKKYTLHRSFVSWPHRMHTAVLCQSINGRPTIRDRTNPRQLQAPCWATPKRSAGTSKGTWTGSRALLFCPIGRRTDQVSSGSSLSRSRRVAGMHFSGTKSDLVGATRCWK